MDELSRRLFLKNLVLLGASVSLPALGNANFSAQDRAPEINDRSPLLNELIVAANIWNRQEPTSPLEYLHLQTDHNITSHTLKGLIRRDFETGNTISINGLILSKCEVAVSLVYAEGYTNLTCL